MLIHLADAASTAASPYPWIGTILTPTIVVVLFLMGKLRTESELNRVIEDAKNKDAVIAAKDELIVKLQAGIVDQAVPALTRVTQLLGNLPVTEHGSLSDVASLVQQIASLRGEMEQAGVAPQRPGRPRPTRPRE